MGIPAAGVLKGRLISHRWMTSNANKWAKSRHRTNHFNLDLRKRSCAHANHREQQQPHNTSAVGRLLGRTSVLFALSCFDLVFMWLSVQVKMTRDDLVSAATTEPRKQIYQQKLCKPALEHWYNTFGLYHTRVMTLLTNWNWNLQRISSKVLLVTLKKL